MRHAQHFRKATSVLKVRVWLPVRCLQTIIFLCQKDKVTDQSDMLLHEFRHRPNCTRICGFGTAIKLGYYKAVGSSKILFMFICVRL